MRRRIAISIGLLCLAASASAQLNVADGGALHLAGGSSLVILADVKMHPGAWFTNEGACTLTGDWELDSMTVFGGDGELVLAGDQQQNLVHGPGYLGKLTVRNPAGGRLGQDLYLYQNLRLDTGSIFLDNHDLVIGPGGSITGGGPGSMVVTDGTGQLIYEQPGKLWFPVGAAETRFTPAYVQCQPGTGKIGLRVTQSQWSPEAGPINAVVWLAEVDQYLPGTKARLFPDWESFVGEPSEGGAFFAERRLGKWDVRNHLAAGQDGEARRYWEGQLSRVVDSLAVLKVRALALGAGEGLSDAEYHRCFFFPNPALNDLGIQLYGPHQGEMVVEAVDLQGKTLQRWFLTKQHPFFEGEISLRDLPSGPLLIRLLDAREGTCIGLGRVFRQASD